MQILGSDSTTQLATPLAAASTSSSTSGTSSTPTTAELSSSDALGNETTFLQLLVAQIQNQDPTAPMDSSTFLNQLAEFSQLEQLIAIQQDVSELDPSTTSTTSTTGTTSTTPTTDPTSGS
jgi:flagellar basal-body rod modification protein FlgD